MLVAVLQLLALFSLLYEGGILACAVKGTNSRRRNLELWAPHRLMTTLKRFANGLNFWNAVPFAYDDRVAADFLVVLVKALKLRHDRAASGMPHPARYLVPGYKRRLAGAWTLLPLGCTIVADNEYYARGLGARARSSAIEPDNDSIPVWKALTIDAMSIQLRVAINAQRRNR
jgi:hypothetical protein